MNTGEPNIDPKLLKPYDPASTEDRIYKLWEESGVFNPDICIEKGFTKADSETFSIVLPPPNVTGTLHIGHASMLTIEDIMTRYARMKGMRTLWLPGTDHAAIATQSKVEKIIEKEEGKRKNDLGRVEFLKRVEKFAQDSHDTIVNQMKKMGTSVDWSREAYTLDDKRNFAVNQVS
jgi:valyl-tRNA synthetase